MKILAPWSIYLAAVLFTPSVVAQQNFPDFCDVSDFTLNGVAGSLTPNADCHLRLTNNLGQSGSAFLTNSISLASDASFSTAFSFQITNPNGGGADGIVFVVQTVANNVGGGGGGIGYDGISNSLGVEFDTWFNSGVDPDASHLGIDLNGSVNSVATQSISPALDDGSIWNAWVDYNGVTDLLEVRVSQSSVRPTNADLSYTVDLVSVLTQTDAFVGFTSGTGAASNQHDILNWQFVGFFDPIGEDDVNPEATFEVTKDFTDGNTAEVMVTLNCFTGLPLTQSQMISENRDVKFIVTSFDDGSLNCNLTETDVTGYTAYYDNGGASTEACSWVGLGYGSNFCHITNTPDLVEVKVFKAWFIDGTGGDMVDPAYTLELWCNAMIDDYDFYGFGNYGKTLFNGTSIANTHYDADVTPYWNGGSKCWVSETVYDSSVDVSSNCGFSLATAGLNLAIGKGDSCTVTNSVFYEGIPTLNPYGLATLILLMLGVGFVGFRRFA